MFAFHLFCYSCVARYITLNADASVGNEPLDFVFLFYSCIERFSRVCSINQFSHSIWIFEESGEFIPMCLLPRSSNIGMFLLRLQNTFYHIHSPPIPNHLIPLSIRDSICIVIRKSLQSFTLQRCKFSNISFFGVLHKLIIDCS